MKKYLFRALVHVSLIAFVASCGAVRAVAQSSTIAEADTGGIKSSPVSPPKVYADSINALEQAFESGDASLLEDSLSPDFGIKGVAPHMITSSLHQVFTSLKGRVHKLSVAEEKATDQGYELKITAGTGSFTASVDKQGKFIALGFFAANPGVSEEQRQVNSPQHSLIPFKPVGRLIMVEGEVNGIKGYLFVDSGAPHCVLNSDIFGDMEGKTIDSKGVLGSTAGVKSVKVDSLKFGGVEVREFAGQCQPLSHLVEGRDKEIKLLGLIGYRELSGFEVLLDYRGKTLRLLKTDADGNKIATVKMPPPSVTIKFEMETHLPVIECELDGQKLRMGLDSGAEANLLDIRLKKKFAKLLVASDNISLTGAEGQPTGVLSGKLPALKVGSVTLTDTLTVFSDISHLNTQPGVLKIDGILGLELLGRVRLSGINFRKQELYLW